MTFINRILALFVVVGFLVTAGACTAPGALVSPAAPPSVSPTVFYIKALDHHYELPAEVSAGYVNVVMENLGEEPHHAQIARLNDGVTLEQFMGAMQASEQEAMALITLPGGPAPVDPGMTQSVTVELTPGQYLVLCLVPSPDGVPHVAKGMLAPFKVTVPVAATATSEPVAAKTIKLVDFQFVLPEAIQAGKQTWKVTNEGTQPHEVALIKLAEGKSIADAQHYMMHPEGAPPFQNVGGFQGIMPGQSGWMDLDLTPGQYIAICHIPDPASGRAHELLGMVMPFTVH